LAAEAIVLFSGGQDSTTCLLWALRNFSAVHALGFSYGQRHSVELAQAQHIANVLNVPYTVLEAPALKEIGGNALTEWGHTLEPWQPSAGTLPNTFVPGRNLLFLTLAAGFAFPLGVHDIVIGVCQTDYSGYPDCRSAFIASAQQTISLALDSDFRIHTPLMHLSKAQTWLLADELGGTQLVREHSHTCYEGNRSALHPWGYGCGKCAACELRARGYYEAFPAGPANHLP
jgi:7-cyano-7-deazaguanine synthase